MIHSERRTKIVATIGPSSNTPEKIEALIKAGVNVCRLNFSHGSHEDHKKVVDMIRAASKKLNYSVPILMDLQGPKIRVGKMRDGAQVIHDGDTVIFTPENVEGDSKTIPIDYPNLVKDASPGNAILMDDGLLEARVTRLLDNAVEAVVVNGGLLKSRKGVNLPNIKVSISAITEKDYADLDFGLTQGVDYVALSFVRNSADVQQLISYIRARGSNAGIIAKIEKPEAVEVIDDIIEEADGIMVARGDLGIEIPSDKVPLVQKLIIDKCRMAGKPVITATQMLESMINNPRPTRAESSDVANAVLDGTDAVMLSGESASGKYPIEAVKAMARICEQVENSTDKVYHSLKFKRPEWRQKQVVESISFSCVRMADDVGAKAIAVVTHSGTTARRIAKYRPKVPVFAFTESQDVRRQLNLIWGVRSVRLDELLDTDKSVEVIESYLKKEEVVGNGDRVVIATGLPYSIKGSTNVIKISTIE
jgi:pyruvate kinase